MTILKTHYVLSLLFIVGCTTTPTNNTTTKFYKFYSNSTTVEEYLLESQRIKSEDSNATINYIDIHGDREKIRLSN